jgi:hypothetical protein
MRPTVFGSRPLLALAALALAWAAEPGGPALADSRVPVYGPGGAFHLGVTSMRERRFSGVVRQQYDFSCGSAAVATLMTYHYGRATDEAEVFQAMWENGDQEKIRTEGFSLLDMKTFLDANGFDSNGYEVPLDKLVDAQIPGITLINTNGYLHFVVIKGVTADEVLVGDPALGMKIYSRDAFEEIWNGILFVVTRRFDGVAQTFNASSAWRTRPRAPLGQALDRGSLASFTITRPGPNDF